MSKALDRARAELGEHAPRIETFKIPTDKIREVIGTGGKVIREIVEKTGAKVNIEDDGTVKVASSDGESIKAAIKWIKSIASDPEVGEIYEGTVVKVMEFGAFVNFFGAKDGLVHISQLAANRVQVYESAVAIAQPQIQAGKIKALAVTGAKRLPDLPQVPTVAESGFAGFEAYSWIGIFAPAGTPQAVMAKLTDEFRATLNQAEVHGKLTAGGFEVMATDGPAVERYAREQYERWGAFVRETRLKLEQ